MVAPVHNLDPTMLQEGPAKLRWGGWAKGQSSIDFIYCWGSNKKQRSCDGRGGA
jgi:hypothetical protein